MNDQLPQSFGGTEQRTHLGFTALRVAKLRCLKKARDQKNNAEDIIINNVEGVTVVPVDLLCRGPQQLLPLNSCHSFHGRFSYFISALFGP